MNTGQSIIAPATAASARAEVSVWRRVRTALVLLAGLRRHDLRAARTFLRVEFCDRALPVRLAKFIGWTLRQMFVVIPDALTRVRFVTPVSRTPFWLANGNPLANHPWSNQTSTALPQQVDTIVIGAGMTGASLAYHWSKRAVTDRTMAVLEMADPGTGASGRSGGTIVMGRYFAMVHKLLEAHWKKTQPSWSEERRDALSRKFASAYCAAAYRNAEMIEQAVQRDGLDCDYARNGWIQIREAGEQQWLTDSVRMAEQSGYADWTRVTPAETRNHCGMQVSTDSGMSRRAGQFHPAKWVWSLLGVALKSPNVTLFTRTKVLGVKDLGEQYLIRTSRGDLRARHVVNATESYTALLHRQFSGLIQVVQTQMCSGVGGPPALKSGITVSGKRWFGERRRQHLLIGSDETRLPDRGAGQNKPSRWITKFLIGEVQRLTGSFDLQIEHEWSGTVGFTPDQFPVVGLMDRKRQYIIGGMCGSGTAVSFHAAHCIVNRILNTTDEPDDYPAEYFAPSRLLNPQQHPWPATQGGD